LSMVALLSFILYPPYALERIYFLISFFSILYLIKNIPVQAVQKLKPIFALVFFGIMNVVFIITQALQDKKPLIPQIPPTNSNQWVCGDIFAVRFVYDY